MTVRTCRLAVGYTSPVATDTLLYTCPAGKTAVIKDVLMSGSGIAATRGLVQVRSGSDRAHIIDQPVGAQEAAHLGCWVVLEPGDTIYAYSTAQPVRVWVSGAELAGVAP